MKSHAYVGAHGEGWGGYVMPMDHHMHKSMQLANVVNFNQPRYHKYQYEEQITPKKTEVIEPGVNELYYRIKDKVHK